MQSFIVSSEGVGLCVGSNVNHSHMNAMSLLTATDLRTSKTAKIKKWYYYITAHRRTSMCSGIVK